MRSFTCYQSGDDRSLAHHVRRDNLAELRNREAHSLAFGADPPMFRCAAPIDDEQRRVANAAALAQIGQDLAAVARRIERKGV